MRFPKSRLGLILASIFLLAAIVSYFAVQDEIFVKIALMGIFTFPWFSIFTPIVAKFLTPSGYVPLPSITTNSTFLILYPLSILINTFVIYWIGAGIQKLFSRFKHKPPKSPSNPNS